LLNDTMPTGLLVSPAMNHGGPFPAPPANGAGQAGHPGFTAAGIPASLLRFAALHGYDNVREPRLPPELRDKNPTGTPCGGGLTASGPRATLRPSHNLR
jgi:2,5-dioxopentanoate dehydrogenase